MELDVVVGEIRDADNRRRVLENEIENIKKQLASPLDQSTRSLYEQKRYEKKQERADLDAEIADLRTRKRSIEHKLRWEFNMNSVIFVATMAYLCCLVYLFVAEDIIDGLVGIVGSGTFLMMVIGIRFAHRE